jgi:hypothetical protein
MSVVKITMKNQRLEISAASAISPGQILPGLNEPARLAIKTELRFSNRFGRVDS